MGLFAKAEQLVGKAGETIGDVTAKAAAKSEGWGAKADAFLGDVLQKAADAVKENKEEPAPTYPRDPAATSEETVFDADVVETPVAPVAAEEVTVVETVVLPKDEPKL